MENKFEMYAIVELFGHQKQGSGFGPDQPIKLLPCFFLLRALLLGG